MKHEPISYREPTGNPIGVYYAQLSPDGWRNVFYQPEMDSHLSPEECLEFTRLVTDFIRTIRDRDALDRYASKYGRRLTKGILPTYGVTVDESYMEYSIRITGCNCEFYPYRKETR